MLKETSPLGGLMPPLLGSLSVNKQSRSNEGSMLWQLLLKPLYCLYGSRGYLATLALRLET